MIKKATLTLLSDALKAIYDKLKARDAIVVCDKWSKDSYNFETSLGVKDGCLLETSLGVKDGCLLGMMVDEDSQSELTEERITTYVAMLKKKFNL